MHTMPQRPARPASTPQNPPATPAPPGAGQTAPQTTGQLEQQLAELNVQRSGLLAQRSSLRSQLGSMRIDNPARPQVQAKDAEVGVQIAQVEGDIARTQAQIAERRGQFVLQPAGPPVNNRRRNPDPDLIVVMSFVLAISVLLPMSVARARRMWRGTPQPRPSGSDDIAPRLDRLEHAIDAIAIEVERVSEGQRFVTKILAERPAAVPPVDGSQIRALGAGAAEPLSLPEREAVRQRNTPR